MEKIGQLNQRLTFKTFLTTRDEYGGVQKNWLTSNEIWAGVEFKDAGSDENFVGDRFTGILNTFFTVRMRDGIATYMRIGYKGNEYNIRSVLPQADKAYLLIKAELTDPEQYATQKFWTDSSNQLWTDPNGNAWVLLDDGASANEPTKKPYISPGGLTWTDSNGNTWFQTT